MNTNQELIKFGILGLFLAGFLSSAFAQEKTCYEVSGTITHSSQYCGGAAPPPELVEQLRQPSPGGKTLYVRKGRTNQLDAPIVDTIRQVDTAGRFSICLPPGTYCIIQEEHLNRSVLEKYLNKSKNNKHIQVNTDCLKKWWEKGLTKLEVKDEPISDLHYHFTKRCFLPIGIPCLTYTGPMPP